MAKDCYFVNIEYNFYMDNFDGQNTINDSLVYLYFKQMFDRKIQNS